MINETEIAAAREAEKRARSNAEKLSNDSAAKDAVRQANAKAREMARDRLPKKA